MLSHAFHFAQSIPENPLAAVIGSLQGLGQLDLQNPTSSSNQVAASVKAMEYGVD